MHDTQPIGRRGNGFRAAKPPVQHRTLRIFGSNRDADLFAVLRLHIDAECVRRLRAAGNTEDGRIRSAVAVVDHLERTLSELRNRIVQYGVDHVGMLLPDTPALRHRVGAANRFCTGVRHQIECRSGCSRMRGKHQKHKSQPERTTEHERVPCFKSKSHPAGRDTTERAFLSIWFPSRAWEPVKSEPTSVDSVSSCSTNPCRVYFKNSSTTGISTGGLSAGNVSVRSFWFASLPLSTRISEASCKNCV